jgi:hypothetical protein
LPLGERGIKQSRHRRRHIPFVRLERLVGHWTLFFLCSMKMQDQYRMADRGTLDDNALDKLLCGMLCRLLSER